MVFKKVNKEALKVMKSLRKGKKSFRQIAKTLNLDEQTIRYYLDKNYSKVKKQGRNEKDKKYISNYMRNRYKNDFEFREKIKERNRKRRKLISKEWKKKGLCGKCGGKKEKKFSSCSKCRRKMREWAKK